MNFRQCAVSNWIGHSIAVSGRHYANNVPGELFTRAADLIPPNAARPVEQAEEKAAKIPAEWGRNRAEWW